MVHRPWKTDSLSPYMMWMWIVITLVLGITIVKYIIYLCSQFYILGNKLPSTKRLPILGHAKDFAASADEFLQQLLIETHKPEADPDVQAIWLGSKLLVILKNHADIERILATNDVLNKSFIYKYLYSWLGNGLVTSPEGIWKVRRKLLTPAFHFKILECFMDTFNRNTPILKKQLEKHVGQEIDILDFIEAYALDIITETAMSTKMNAQLEKSDFSKAIKGMTKCIIERGFRIWLQPSILYWLSPTGREERRLLKIIKCFVNKIIMQRKEERLKQRSEQQNNISVEDEDIGHKKKSAFLDSLLDIQEQDDTFTDKDVLDEVNTFMFAGHDTVSSAMSFTILALSQHQDVQEKVLEEVHSTLGVEERPIAYKDLCELKYLERVIKETMRLYPPVPYIGRENQQNITLNSGHVLPAGATIFIFIYDIHRSPANFTNPEKFDPDRFLLEKPSGNSHFAYIPFSAGSRNCIGQRFAMNEMKVTLAHLVRHFRILPSGSGSVIPTSHLVLRSKNGFKVKLEKRSTV